MKKKFASLMVILLFCILFFSCEKGKLLNSEADILEIILPDSLQIGEPIITNTEIRIPKLAILPSDIAKTKEQLRLLTPQFILTEGAIISDVGVAKNFNELQTYIVTSEDRKWTKEYKIYFFDATFNNDELDFAYYEIFANGQKSYYRFYEQDNSTGVRQDVWDSGNKGFAMTAHVTTPPEDYPTAITLNGKERSGAKLVTRSTGVLGANYNMPIAAGNLFIGNFEFKGLGQNQLKATLFGVPTTQPQPKELSLWAKYKAGPEYTDENGLPDSPEIYAVLYEPEINDNGYPVKLDGTNIKSSNNIVSIAEITSDQVEQIRVDDIESDEYVHIMLTFKPGSIIFDPEKQKTGSYYITIVFSSSAKGSSFEGAVGSTLCIDKIKFIRFDY